MLIFAQILQFSQIVSSALCYGSVADVGRFALKIKPLL
jgi:hypothetical protein